MTATFELNPGELTESLLAGIRNIANDYRLKITVEAAEMDETNYLLSTETNRKALEKSIASTEVYSFSLDEFNDISERMLSGETVNVEIYKHPLESVGHEER